MTDYKEINSDINFGNLDNITIKSNLIVRIDNKLVLHAPNGSHEINVRIHCDLEQVPEEYREVFLNMLTVKYLNKTSFVDNPFSKCYEASKPWYSRLVEKIKNI
jgi:DNA topoisomerase IB